MASHDSHEPVENEPKTPLGLTLLGIFLLLCGAIFLISGSDDEEAAAAEEPAAEVAAPAEAAAPGEPAAERRRPVARRPAAAE